MALRLCRFNVASSLQPSDLFKVRLIPVMKPSQVSHQRQIAQATALMQAAEGAPDILNKRKAAESYVSALGLANVEDYMMPDEAEVEPPQPADPVTEYAQLLSGAGATVGIHQNHKAHIQAHAAQMRVAQNSQLTIPTGQSIVSLIDAHIAEHYAAFAMQIVSKQMGVTPEQLQMAQQNPQLAGQIDEAIAQAMVQMEAELTPEEGQQQADPTVLAAQIRAEASMQEKQLKAQSDMDLQNAKDAAAMERQQLEQDHQEEIEAIKGENDRAIEQLKKTLNHDIYNPTDRQRPK